MDAPGATTPATAARIHLPTPLTTLVGRERELTVLATLLRHVRAKEPAQPSMVRQQPL